MIHIKLILISASILKNNGINVNDNTIIIPEGTKEITVSIKDNALNWTAIYINVF